MERFPNLVRSVFQLIQKNGLIVSDDRVLVAFSGGPDSTALADILFQLREGMNFKMVLFHLNHGLRGEEARRDQNFCIDWAAFRNLEIIVDQGDVSAYQKELSLSLEDAARQVRYQTMKKAAQRWGVTKIALGHHRNDQIETILMNILRGTGYAGLRGMPLSNGLFIRPLLMTPQEKIYDYLKERNLSYVVDSTNTDISFLRNRIRHQLIPLLKREFNPNIEEVLFRLGLNLQESKPEISDEQWPVENRGHFCRLPIKLLVDTSMERQRQGFISLIKQIKGDAYHVTRAHIKALEFILKKGKGKTMLPGCITLWIEEGFLYARRGDILLGEVPPWHYSLVVPGVNILNDIGLKVDFFEKKSPTQLDLKAWWCELDRDRCDPPFYLRNFLNGDRVVVNTIEKKLNSVFQEQGIDESWRKRLPILYDQNKILWIPGVLLDERAQVQENSKSILIVSIGTYKR